MNWRLGSEFCCGVGFFLVFVFFFVQKGNSQKKFLSQLVLTAGEWKRSPAVPPRRSRP